MTSIQSNPVEFNHYNLKKISFELGEKKICEYNMSFSPDSLDYIEPFMALKNSFNSLAERHEESGTPTNKLHYQQLQLPSFITDPITFMDRLFLVC